MFSKTIFTNVLFFLYLPICISQSFLSPNEIFADMKIVAERQISDIKKNGLQKPITSWTNNAYLSGQMAWAKMANDQTQMNFLISVGAENAWEIDPDKTEDFGKGQMYTNLFGIYQDSSMIKPLLYLGDKLLDNILPKSTLHQFKGDFYESEWNDSFFTGLSTLGNIYTLTGNVKYLDRLNDLWWAWSDHFYDRENQLYFVGSRNLGKKENPNKVFAISINGRVLAELIKIINQLPADYPARNRFVNLFLNITKRIAGLQLSDGTWNNDLLYQKKYSGRDIGDTGLFTYSMAWGINQGYLSYNQYISVIKKSWSAMREFLQPVGKQNFGKGSDNLFRRANAHDLGTHYTGAFLLAGTELFKLMFNRDSSAKKLVVVNTIPLDRKEEIVELQWKQFEESNFDPKNIKVVNAQTNQEIPSQVVYNGGQIPVSIIFQTEVSAGNTDYYYFKKQKPGIYTNRTYGRQVPERYDDFTWENDRIAFRMYGAALDARPDNAKGIDLWAKKTSKMIIDEWYKTNDYHKDHGDGLDAYHVGMTLGAGNSAPLHDNNLVFSGNYSSYRILDAGPLRLVFELVYQPWEVNNRMVQQVKTISLDAGSNINKITDRFQFEGKELTIAAGITKHKNDGSISINKEHGFISYWDQADGNKVDNGKIGVGILIPKYENVDFKDDLGHLLAVSTLSSYNQQFVYYQGGAWNRSGLFENQQVWIDYLVDFSRKLESPLRKILY